MILFVKDASEEGTPPAIRSDCPQGRKGVHNRLCKGGEGGPEGDGQGAEEIDLRKAMIESAHAGEGYDLLDGLTLRC